MKFKFFLLFLVSSQFVFSQTKKDLKTQLESIYISDQKPRQGVTKIIEKYGYDSPQMDSLNRKITQTDSINLLKIKQIIDVNGWLGISEVGEMANQALFLVIQHADLANREKYFPLMEKSVQQKESNSRDLALLEDRILIDKGQKQKYGTQLKIKTGTQNEYELYPIEDERNVDKRRKKVGLEPLRKYLEYRNIKYKRPRQAFFYPSGQW